MRAAIVLTICLLGLAAAARVLEPQAGLRPAETERLNGK